MTFGLEEVLYVALCVPDAVDVELLDVEPPDVVPEELELPGIGNEELEPELLPPLEALLVDEFASDEISVQPASTSSTKPIAKIRIFFTLLSFVQFIQ